MLNSVDLQQRANEAYLQLDNCYQSGIAQETYLHSLKSSKCVLCVTVGDTITRITKAHDPESITVLAGTTVNPLSDFAVFVLNEEGNAVGTGFSFNQENQTNTNSMETALTIVGEFFAKIPRISVTESSK